MTPEGARGMSASCLKRRPNFTLNHAPTGWSDGGACSCAVLPRTVDPYLQNSSTCRDAVEKILANFVNVDLHPARPGRGMVAGRLPNTDVDEPSFWSFAPHLIPIEFGPRSKPDRKIEGQRLPRFRTLRI